MHPTENKVPKNAPTDKDDTEAAAAAAGDEINEEELEERVEQSRSRSKMTRRGNSKSKNKTDQMNHQSATKATTTTSLSEMFTAVWKFGCALQNLLLLSSQQQQQQCAAILVLDHAERLLSLASPKAAKDRINFLSQIMLLPQLLKLNLTVIVISKSSLLTSSRKYFIFCQRVNADSSYRLIQEGL